MWTDLFQTWYYANMTKPYNLISVWMTLMFTQGHRVTGMVEFVQSLCCKAAWSKSNVCDCWLCKEDDHGEDVWVWRIWMIWALILFFLQTSQLILMKFSMVPQSVVLLKLMINIFCIIFVWSFLSFVYIFKKSQFSHWPLHSCSLCICILWKPVSKILLFNMLLLFHHLSHFS